jgi:cytochrome c peroxidase
VAVLGLMAPGACDTGLPTGTADDTSAGRPASDAEVIARHLSIDLSAPIAYSSHTYPVHYIPVVPNDNAPLTNPVTDRGATLGRVLFYDTQLSLNGTVSCASCHEQELGFTDGARLSEGFDGGLTGAHSMRLANANFYRGEEMFWDRRADALEDQVLEPILDETEMGFSEHAGGVDAVLARIREQEYYPILFAEAFGTDDVTELRLRSALAQYVRSIVSTDSRYDAAVASFGVPIQPGQMGELPGFDAEENLGLRLFALPPGQGGAGCSGCHELPSLALDPNSRSNGLDAGETTIFKAPSLKNVAVSGPYMHDGRFETLLEVVEHYDGGVQPGPALDRRLTAGGPVRPGGPGGGAPIRLNLTDAEKLALVAFMETLTDTALLTDPRFTDPFTGR